MLSWRIYCVLLTRPTLRECKQLEQIGPLKGMDLKKKKISYPNIHPASLYRPRIQTLSRMIIEHTPQHGTSLPAPPQNSKTINFQ